MADETPITKEDAIRLVEGPFGEATLKSVAQYAAPIFWELGSGSPDVSITNGTIFIVRTEKRLFGVTANHVIQSYLEEIATTPELPCWIAPEDFNGSGKEAIPIKIGERIIDRLERPDLATFELSEDEVQSIGSTVSTNWPPVTPREEQAIVFAGYPGNERLEIGEMELSFAPFPALTIAKSVRDTQIACQFEYEHLVTTQGFQRPPEDIDTGGMSGGPLFSVIEKNGILRWHLGGVIAEGNAALGILTAAPAHYILEDGQLLR